MGSVVFIDGVGGRKCGCYGWLDVVCWVVVVVCCG